MIGLVGRKCGMMRAFGENGEEIPISVIELPPNRVTQLKSAEQEGYCAVQVTMGTRRVSTLSKPLLGHYAKADVSAGEGLWEFRASGDAELPKVGGEWTVASLANIKFVDVSGISKGKGFAGVIKRHNFNSQGNSHGISLAHRAPGSVGQNQSPGRVFKGKKMAGQMGGKRCTVQNLAVVEVDEKRNLLLVKGGVPGAAAGYVLVQPAVKKSHPQGK